jgi:hypothetical protein
VSARRGPKPRVTYNGRTYTCRAWKVEIPDLDAMDRTGALVWLNQNTTPTGAGIRTKPNPLAGMGSILAIRADR